MALQVVVSQQGPLPIKVSFEALSDAPAYLEVNGSVWSATPDTVIGIGVELDGLEIGTAQIFSNGASTHRVVVPAYIAIQLGEGEHTLTLFANTVSTTSDTNDAYTAVIHY